MTHKFTEPEGQTLEYKQAWSDTAKKTLIAFANDFGGILEFGVADSGEVLGCNFDEIDRQVMTFARQGVEPPLTDLVRIVPRDFDGKTVASVIVSPGPQKPYSFKGKLFSSGGVYIRLGGQTVAANTEEVIALIRRGNPREWETRLCEADPDSLTFESAAKIFAERNVLFSEAAWLGYGLVNARRHFTNLALLVSDQCPARLAVNTFGPDGRIAKTERIRGSLLAQMTAAREILEKANTPAISKRSGRQERLERHPWPVLALREALTNSLAHRDYSSPVGASVNIYPDRIVFMTPGGIPPEITLEDALAEGTSFCRNEKLADIFLRLGWMEKIGTGFSDIFREYAPYEQKPEVRHIVRIFQIELPRTDRKANPRERLAIDFVRGSEAGRTRAEIEAFLGVSRPTAAKILKAVLSSGQLVAAGRGRSVRYLVPSASAAELPNDPD